MSDISTRLKSINDRIAAASVQRSRRAIGFASINIIIAGLLAMAWINWMVLPAVKRVNNEYQEQVAHK